MFSQELENLIQATLEDGILEDYEKAALAKRAQAEGVDLSELEIYINSILQKRKRELAQAEDAKQAVIDQKKKAAFGRVCPNCGRQVPPMTLKCECGYEFSAEKTVSSAQLLMEKIEKISNAPSTIKEGKFLQDTDKLKREEANKKTNQIVEAISLFPVPNTKEDIIEFLSLAISQSKTKGGLWGTVTGRISIIAAIAVICATILAFIKPELISLAILFSIGAGYFALIIDQETLFYNKKAVAWRNKFEQVIIKGRSLRGDAEFTQQLDYYENLLRMK